MLALVSDPELSQRFIAERHAAGADHHDEVWEGIYVMTPSPNNEHQELVLEVGFVLREVVKTAQLGTILPGPNLTDRPDDWTQNYRCPDLVVFLRSTQAENRDTHWLGGPDFVVEIVSPGDQTREKIPFYESIGTRELLIIDRNPWQLELLRLVGAKLSSVGVATVDRPQILASESVPLTWSLEPGDQRARIALRHSTSDKTWCI